MKILIPKTEIITVKKKTSFKIAKGITINNLQIKLHASKDKKVRVYTINVVGPGGTYVFNNIALGDKDKILDVDSRYYSTIWKVEKLEIIAASKHSMYLSINSKYNVSSSPFVISYIGLIKGIKKTIKEKNWHIGYSKNGGVVGDEKNGCYFEVGNAPNATELFEYFIDEGFNEIPFIDTNLTHVKFIAVHSS